MIADRIHVEYWAKPIPPREFDYCATFDSYDGSPDTPASARPQGHGATAYEAIVDLLMQCDDEPCAEADDAAPLVEWSL